MARVKRAVNAQKKRRTTLARAEGYRGQRSRLYRKAKEQVTHSLGYSYRDRKARKGDFRRLWIQRINAASREQGLTYNRFVQGLKAAGLAGRPPDARRARRQRPDRRSRPWSRRPRPRCRPTATRRPPDRLGPTELRSPTITDVASPELTDPRSARVRRLGRLARRAYRAEQRRFLAEGAQAGARGAERAFRRRRSRPRAAGDAGSGRSTP